MSTMVGLAGLGLAGVGLAHSAKPDAFESITAQAFPENAQQHLHMDEGQAKLCLNSGFDWCAVRVSKPGPADSRKAHPTGSCWLRCFVALPGPYTATGSR